MPSRTVAKAMFGMGMFFLPPGILSPQRGTLPKGDGLG
jgi:hypothetical protein